MTEEALSNDDFLGVQPSSPSTILKEMAAKAMEFKRLAEECDAAASAYRHSMNQILQKEMVDAMTEQGFPLLVTEDKVKFEISTFVTGSLPKEEQARKKAIDWLTENGQHGLIKSEVAVAFSRDQYEVAEELCRKLNDEGFPVTLDTSVHASTLQAWAKESLKSGAANIPFELLGLGHGQYVKVTEPKKKVEKKTN